MYKEIFSSYSDYLSINSLTKDERASVAACLKYAAVQSRNMLKETNEYII